ncbi:MAG: cysteine--tRNA ligase [Firmicutes bacterium]|nr:cysteine--tRNA ligase [Bacillota bacterium]
MPLKVYNTMSRRKELLETREPGKASIYVCGITPYSKSHAGHARPSIVWDTIRRYLEYKGYEVFMVQNFTDIDDKIIAASQREGIHFKELAGKYSEDYLRSMDLLKVKRANVYPRATNHVGDIIDMVKTLVDKGYAYESGGDVYFDVSKFDGYGKLSHRSLDEMLAGARVDPGEKKRDPMDFALWKAAKPGEPHWDSPWGPGRPGWHIECSAMSLQFLGNGFDFHGGGSDLIFPHHENEVAQSEAYTGEKPFVRYWLHNELLNIKGEKMAKSVGNVVALSDVLDRYPPEVIRLQMLSAHYRTPVEFSDEALESARSGWRRLEETLAEARLLLAGKDVAPAEAEAARAARGRFEEAMDDDFNTALAVGVLFDLARDIKDVRNRLANATLSSSVDLAELAGLVKILEDLGGILGILKEPAQAGVAGTVDERTIDGLMRVILDLREVARRKKDWETADTIRERLGEIGFVIEDTAAGPRWKRERRD